MSWTYSQSSGALCHDGQRVGDGYSGNDLGPEPCKNRPDKQNVHNHGPIPRGVFLFAEWIEYHPRLGFGVIALRPSMDNQMFGRAGFYIHGDNPAHPGQSSDGCIVYGHVTERRQVWEHADHYLEVM
jgi:hypothetical protein